MTISTVKATINGSEYTLTYNSVTQKYEATATAPTQTSGMNNTGQGPGVGTNASGKGYYPVTVVATDDAGNITSVDDTDPNLGPSCRLPVLEKVAPVSSVTYPTAGATITNNRPAIAVRITDSGSGVNPSTCKIKIDSGAETAVTLSGSGTTFTGTYTPGTALAEGNHTIRVYAYDYDGNKSNVVSITFKIDTTPPTLVVDAPTDSMVTNSTSGTVSGTTNDLTSSPVTVAITVNGVDAGAVTVNANGTFSKNVTYSQGSNTVVVTATDSAGKFSTVTRTVTVNTTAPVITAVTITPNPSDAGATFTIAVTVTDA